ncbi:Aspartic peptidase domain-containing protein [Madurella fahalii]|uniref:Aspartic peptidase domain-containing protein n=1 Tax=Madurella fahalii TaxID=1157608 RepID=A0ABQ0GKJ1_9PEZI
MLHDAFLCILLFVAVCHGAVLPNTHPPINSSARLAEVGNGDQVGARGNTRYVRMPISRHKFNGTGRWPWGWHWSPPPGFPGPWPWPGSSSPFQPTGTRSQQTPRTWPTIQPGFPGQPSPPWPSFPTPSINVPNRPPFFAPTASSLSTVTKAMSTQSTTLSATPQPPARRQAQTHRRWGWSSLEELGGIAYIIQLEIGTPPQKIKVFIDTGSYELWVNPRCKTSASEAICESHGYYYPNKSNSSMYVGGNFAVTYGTGAVRGSYWSDIMSIAMFQIPQVQFAVASDSTYTFSGILGLGYAYPYSINYPSVLNLMVAQKMISAPIFSLGLGGDRDGFSEIIFGGVNRWKFAGHLEPVPIWPPISEQDPRWIQYWVNVTSVGMTKPGEHAVIYTHRDTFVMPTLIDTGSTLSYIREDLVDVIGQQFEATIDSQGNYIVDCSWREKSGTVDFGFNRGRMVINVRYKDFIYQQYPGHCMLGVQPADVGSTNFVLGDTFIRGAYLVFDQQSDTVWMNQYYNCGDGVVTVGETPRDTQHIVGAC